MLQRDSCSMLCHKFELSGIPTAVVVIVGDHLHDSMIVVAPVRNQNPTYPFEHHATTEPACRAARLAQLRLGRHRDVITRIVCRTAPKVKGGRGL